MKLDYKKTFLIGFGFFATTVWVIYNTYVPIFLTPLTAGWKIGNWQLGSLAVGTIMVIDNIFGVIFQPFFGSLSDRTRSRYGKRMPFILIGIPVCALVFALIPTASSSLFWLMFVIILFTFGMSTWRSQVVALMPDLTPAPLRSKANGVINMMGGIGGIIAFFAGGAIFSMTNKNPQIVDGVKVFNYNAPFWLGSVVMLLALVVLFFFVKEPSSLNLEQVIKKHEKTKEKLELDKGEKKSLLLILIAIFLWFTGYNAIETFFSKYCTEILIDSATQEHLTGGQASILLGVFSASLAIFAIPAGILGGKIGRKKTILIGLAGITCIFVPLFFIQQVTLLYGLLFLSGMFWAFVNINSLPMVVELAGAKHIGAFTGYYYTFSFSSAVVSPILFGLLMTLTKDNYGLMFIYAAVAFIIAIGCIAFVKHGESVTPEHRLTTEQVMGMQED